MAFDTKAVELIAATASAVANEAADAAEMLDTDKASVSDVPEPLFDRSTDAPTTGLIYENLYTDSILAGTLSNDNDKIVAEYAFSFAANANNKRVISRWDSTDLVDSGGLVESGIEGKILLTLIRLSNTALRSVAVLMTGVYWPPTRVDITGLDLDATAYPLIFRARSSTAIGDVTARMGHAIKIPAAA